VSTFSGLNTAYTALVASRQGLDVVGQNIANTNTQGYTRQRVTTSSIGGVESTGLLSNGLRVGQGVSVDGIARLGNIFLDSRVRTSAASAGYWGVQANAMANLETILQEPGENGLSAQLQEFWAAWQDVANKPGEPASAGVLLAQAGVLVSQINRGYSEVENQWGELRTEADSMVAELNSAASQIADLNARIRSAQTTGGSVNEMLDKRSVLTATIASLAGGTTRELDDGTTEILIGGNALVSGDAFRPVKAVGGYLMQDAATNPVNLEWEHRPGAAIGLDGGEVAGVVALLAPAAGGTGGTGGALAEAAESYNAFATRLASKVNAVHQSGFTNTGTAGGEFFSLTAGLPAARGIGVVPATLGDIAASSSATSHLDGSIADSIAQLALEADSPDALWSSIVTGIGVASRTATQQSTLSNLASSAAVGAQLAHSSVDLDEENVNMLTFQLAYQGAARVMTAVDEMLDTLINRTGLVGR